MMKRPFTIIPYHPQYAVETINMWRDSKERAIGQKEIHDWESHLYFLEKPVFFRDHRQNLPEGLQLCRGQVLDLHGSYLLCLSNFYHIPGKYAIFFAFFIKNLSFYLLAERNDL